MKTHIRDISHILAALAIVTPLITATSAEASNERVKAFFEAQGCAIGPSTIAASIVDGIDPPTIQAYAETVRADPKTVVTGDWLVLSPDACTIHPPIVKSEIAMSDPEVIQNLSAIDAYAKDGDIGCFLNGDGLVASLQTTRKWTNDEALLKYLRFLSASISSGELSFYSPDPLRTPPGFIATRGKCAETPRMPDIVRSHDLLVRHFDALIRADAAGGASCDDDSVPSLKLNEVAQRIFGDKPLNAFLGSEIRFMAIGGGWFDGTTARRQGSPRPPLCHYK